MSPRPVAPDDASGEIPRPTRELRDDAPTLRRMLRPDLTPRSLRRSHDAEGRARQELAHEDRRRLRRRPALPGRLGHQPGLDGLRGLSVLAVIGYHAGFGWLHGGWIGVEVFFVVSGFLITSLLVEEREATGRVDLRQFWLRRARRLLPALGVMLAVIATVTLVVGSAAERSGVRRDLPWAFAYLSNWGQITGDVPYFAAEAPVLRHLWSLAIEEQFYVVWPLVFVALARTRMRPLVIARTLAILAAVAMVTTVVLQLGGPGPLGLLGGVDRTNFMYLSTITRSSGLLLGAAAAYVWRPGRRHTGTGGDPGRALDLVGGLALAVLACAAIAATLTAGYVYLWLLPVVSVLSLAAVLVTVHPSSQLVRRALSWRPLATVGLRSYGLYLWHWPVFVLVGATHGSIARFLTASAITIVATEVSYRIVETPARRGGIGHWWHHAGPARTRVLLMASCGVLLVAGCYGAVRPFDPAVGGGDAAFTAPTTPAPAVTAAPDGAVQPPAPPTTPVSTATRVAIVGDSQAHSLAVNLPDGIDDTFDVTDGAIDGCSVYDGGRVLSARTTFRNYFQICAGWQDEWADAVARSDASVALVVLGAWDVFDRETADGSVLNYATPAWDADLTAHLQEGIDALVGAGARVAILEVACMRPISVEGAAVPVLPERADDSRVAHVNEIFRAVAAANAATTTFVEGPDWCGDEALATDVGMRWDGVHVYKPGARLIFDTIAPSLLAP